MSPINNILVIYILKFQKYIHKNVLIWYSKLWKLDSTVRWCSISRWGTDSGDWETFPGDPGGKWCYWGLSSDLWILDSTLILLSIQSYHPCIFTTRQGWYPIFIVWYFRTDLLLPVTSRLSYWNVRANVWGSGVFTSLRV